MHFIFFWGNLIKLNLRRFFKTFFLKSFEIKQLTQNHFTNSLIFIIFQYLKLKIKHLSHLLD